MTTRRSCRLAPLAWLALCLAGTPAARADWDSARSFFSKNVKSAEWSERRSAYQALADHDRGEAVDAVLSNLANESQPAVVAAAVDTISRFRATTARAALVAAARTGKPTTRLYATAALRGQLAPEVDALLAELVAGPSAPVAAQAALALGDAGRSGSLAALVPLLDHGHWQVRTAAARALAALGDRSAGKALAARLPAESGRARLEVVAALEGLSGKRLGDAPAKWKAWAEGQDPDKVEEKAKVYPTAFGVPVSGQRVVFVLDRSLNMSDAHPFDRTRLEKLCAPPDGDKIPWFRLKSKLQFAQAQILHAVEGLPGGTRFEVVTFAADVQGVFGKKFTGVGAAARKTLADAFDGLKTDDGINIYEALNAALDLAGAGDDKAWKSGPEEIVFVTNNVPTQGEVKDADSVAAAMATKARLRMVPIHVVGIGNHPFQLAETISKRTGGTYVNLTQ